MFTLTVCIQFSILGPVESVRKRQGVAMTTVQDALDEYLMTIGGSATGAASGRTYDSVDPYTGQPWARVPDAGPEGVDAAVAAARAALDGPWGQLTATQRGKLLRRLGDLIAREAPRLAEVETRGHSTVRRETCA